MIMTSRSSTTTATMMTTASCSMIAVKAVLDDVDNDSDELYGIDAHR
jgi:hypothetical protein